MKIMLVSDIHGNLECLDKVLEIYYKEKVDKIIFLGDFYSFYVKDEIETIRDSIDGKVLKVATKKEVKKTASKPKKKVAKNTTKKAKK